MEVLMITTPQNRVDDAIADSLPSPINHLRIPFVIVLAGLLFTVAVFGHAQNTPQQVQSVAASTDASGAVTPTPEPSKGVDVHDAQNPVASLISIPLQGNTYFDYGPYRRTADVLLVEPVIPLRLSEN